MARDLGGQGAEGLDHEDEQDGLGTAETAFNNRRIFIHEQQGFSQRF
jgi:hypothetical protein